jgi:hypothetical protein
VRSGWQRRTWKRRRVVDQCKLLCTVIHYIQSSLLLYVPFHLSLCLVVVVALAIGVLRPLLYLPSQSIAMWAMSKMATTTTTTKLLVDQADEVVRVAM